MKLLDLFCGAGGAAVGYHRAGFDEIVGIDIEPQPNYPFEFIQADVMEWDGFAGFDLIHASPPCQIHSDLKTVLPKDHQHQDFVADTRERLQGSRYVIENVPGAPLINPIQLCGSAFGGRADLPLYKTETSMVRQVFELRRHRLFECTFPIMAPPCNHQAKVLGVYGDLSKHRRPSNRGVKAGIRDAELLMGIDWMTPKEIVQAVPPAYTEYIGRAFLEQQ